jgi:hypothetical protein
LPGSQFDLTRIPRAVRSVRAEWRVQAPAARAELELAAIGRGDGPVIAGPWLSEVGPELLFWIPLLNRLAAKRGIGPNRMIAVSRGGAGAWYSDICARTVDMFEFFDPSELRQLMERAEAESGTVKQLHVRDFDRQLLDRVRDRLGIDAAHVLHPATMHRLFAPVWLRRRPVGFIERRVDFKPLPQPVGQLPPNLPRDYVVVKAYFSLCFPETPENRAWLSQLIGTLARHVDVVMLTTGIAVDDHAEFERLDDHPRVFDATEHMTPQNNLEVQSRIVAGARAMFATYGGFSYLGPFLGIPSYAFYSELNFNPTHLDAMNRAIRDLHQPDRNAGFCAFHVDDALTLGRLLREREVEAS